MHEIKDVVRRFNVEVVQNGERAAFEELIAKNDPNDFGANNRPKASTVKEVSGLNVDAKERDRIWMIYMAKKSAED